MAKYKYSNQFSKIWLQSNQNGKYLSINLIWKIYILPWPFKLMVEAWVWKLKKINDSFFPIIIFYLKRSSAATTRNSTWARPWHPLIAVWWTRLEFGATGTTTWTWDRSSQVGRDIGSRRWLLEANQRWWRLTMTCGWQLMEMVAKR